MTGSNDKSSINGFKALASHFLFGGDAGAICEKAHDKPLFIQPGKDTFSEIGEPKVFLLKES